jgi:uncharacterized protein YndB with AHSA1/START domain
MSTNGKATTIKTTFSRETAVNTQIHADASVIWALLTNAAEYPRWNSTVTSLEGKIQLVETIRLKSYLDDKRVFKLKIKEWVANQKLVWGDAMGSRVFTLTDHGDGTVAFSMTEKIGGLMFPLFARFIPPFDESFEKFAADLKKEAEAVMGEK